MTAGSSRPSSLYRAAGVDIDAGKALVDKIRPLLQTTHRPEVSAGIGGFASLCALPAGYKEPLLAAGSDGVGTKLKLALEMQSLDSIGIDLVAMCVNDLLCCGAEPLFFLDYYASGKIDPEQASQVIAGIAAGCREAGCALLGGETAEMPGLYRDRDFDLAGFCVGVVERSQTLGAHKARIGDVLLALPSSGAHANGYSLVRHLLRNENAWREQDFGGAESLGDALLRPTRIYAGLLDFLRAEDGVHALAHITGGGLTENIPRILPSAARAQINLSSWEYPPLFRWLQERGNIPEEEMLRTFNCGVGMVLCVDESRSEVILQVLQERGEPAWHLGELEKSEGPAAIVFA